MQVSIISTGLSFERKPSFKITTGTKQEVLSLIEQGYDAKQISKQLDMHLMTFYRVLRILGINAPTKNRNIIRKNVDNVLRQNIDLLLELKLSSKEIASRFNLKQNDVDEWILNNTSFIKNTMRENRIKQGCSIKEFAKEFAISEDQSQRIISKYKKEHNIVDVVVPTLEKYKDVIAELQKGYSMVGIAKKYNISTRKLFSLKKEANINSETIDAYRRKRISELIKKGCSTVEIAKDLQIRPEWLRHMMRMNATRREMQEYQDSIKRQVCDDVKNNISKREIAKKYNISLSEVFYIARQFFDKNDI